jgi:hypothetical protein
MEPRTKHHKGVTRTMTRTTIAAAVAVVSLGWAAPALAGVIPVRSILSLEANASADQSGVVTDLKTQSQGAATNPLAVSVDALAVSGMDFAEASAIGSATWTSPGVGHVAISVSWTTSAHTGSVVLGHIPDFYYQFIPDASGTMTLTYSIVGGGSDTFGLQGFAGAFGGGFPSFPLGSSGTLSTTVVAGTTYDFYIGNEANISGGIGTRDAQMTGTFDFNIPSAGPTAVPEPSTFALLGIGMVGVGGYVWRRRRLVAP